MTRPSAPPRPRAARAVRALALPVLVSSCYSGDFFDRLVDPDITAAFRITDLTLIDPHFYSGDAVNCTDSTDTYNQIWTDSLLAFDINPILVLAPLDPKISANTTMQIVPADCIASGDAVNCSDRDVPPEDITEAAFSNLLQGGMCGGPIMGSLNPLYMDDTNEPLNAPQGPCFISALIPTLELPLGPQLKLPLSNVQISATYHLDGEPQQLVQGLLVGFLPASQATTSLGSLNGSPFRPWGVLAGGEGCQPTDVPPPMPIDDIDTVSNPRDGVWMYFNFLAERVAWSTVSAPMVDPPSGA